MLSLEDISWKQHIQLPLISHGPEFSFMANLATIEAGNAVFLQAPMYSAEIWGSISIEY